MLTAGVTIVQFPANDPTTYLPLKDSQDRFYFPRSFHELGQLSTGATEVARELTKRGLENFSNAAAGGGLAKRSATYEGIEEDLGLKAPAMNYSIGLTAVLISAVISGLTGVYFEKVLKESKVHVTVWTRNVQLCFYSLFPALIFGVFFKDGEEIAKEGFFVGYNWVVWTAIVFQAVGGVLVAVCINYADNIAKNFATSISIVLSFFVSVWFFEFPITFTVSSRILPFFPLSYYSVTRDNSLIAEIVYHRHRNSPSSHIPLQQHRQPPIERKQTIGHQNRELRENDH